MNIPRFCGSCGGQISPMNPYPLEITPAQKWANENPEAMQAIINGKAWVVVPEKKPYLCIYQEDEGDGVIGYDGLLKRLDSPKQSP